MIIWLENNRKFAIMLTLLIAIEIFLVSSIPGEKTYTGALDLSVLYHLSAFFLLNFFLLVAIIGKKKIKAAHILAALPLSLAYAVLDEIHQMFVPLRSAGMADILVDGAGILLSIAVYFYSRR